MGLNAIFDELAKTTKQFFNQAGELSIKRVTDYVPENVPKSECPWLCFYADTGTSEKFTFASDKNKVTNVKTFGSPPPIETVKRPSIKITHNFKAQLLVRPRKSTKEDEPLTRGFIEPFIIFIAENKELGGLVLDCQVTGYTYGAFTLGVFNQKPVVFIGLIFDFECTEVI